MKHWFIQHKESLRLVLSRMWRTPMATLMMLGVMGVTLCLPAILYVVVESFSRFSGSLESEPQISLFLALDIKPEDVKQFHRRLREHAGVKEFRFVSRDKAWQDLRQNAGLDEFAGGLERNPLPDAFIIRAKNTAPVEVEQLQKELAQWEHVEHVQIDAAWIKRLYALLDLGRKVVMVLAALLGFALLAVVGNTIRLQILTQREEIEVSMLIGATDRFIRRPFLYAGMLYGVGGGVAAWIMLYGVLFLFNSSVEEFARLYASDFRLHMLNMQASLVMVVGAAALGWLGSYLAVNRHFARNETN